MDYFQDLCPFLKVFQSYRDDGMVIMRGYVQQSPIFGFEGFRLQ